MWRARPGFGSHSSSSKPALGFRVLGLRLQGARLRVRGVRNTPQVRSRDRAIQEEAREACQGVSTCIVFVSRCRANMAHIRQPMPDSGLGFQLKVLQPFYVVSSLLGSGLYRGDQRRRRGARRARGRRPALLEACSNKTVNSRSKTVKSRNKTVKSAARHAAQEACHQHERRTSC